MNLKRFAAILWAASLTVALPAAAASGPFGYSAWGRNPAIVTWAGVGTSGTSLDIYASSSSKFVAFDDSTGAWAENPARTWVSTADSSTIPGYTDTAPFWRAFSYGAAGYVAPGLALRFKPNTGSIAGTIDGNIPTFALGGLIVESGATGYALGASGVSTVRHMQIGDPVYGGETFFDVRENFTIRRGATADSTNTLSGAVNVYVASGKVFNLNANNPQAELRLATEVPTVLKMSGEGKITNAVLRATGPVTLDFSALSTSRQPFISGGLVVDKSTRFRFPAGLNPYTNYQICGGALTANAAEGTRAITVGDESFFAYVTFNVTTKTARYDNSASTVPVNRATVDRDTSWSGLKWESKYVRGEPIELTVTNADVRLTFDTDADLGPILVKGDKELSLVLKRNQSFDGIFCSPRASYAIVYPSDGNQDVTKALTVGVGEKIVIEGGSSGIATRKWTGAVTVLGTLVTRGSVELANVANVVSRPGRLEVDGGNLLFNSAAGALKGALVVGEGAFFAAGCSGSLPDAGTDGARIEVRGELSVGSNRWVLAKASALALYAGGSITGVGDGVAAIDFYGMEKLTVGAAEGSDAATVSAPLRYRANLALEIGEGVTFNLADTNSSNTAGYKVRMSGDGALSLVAGAEIALDPTVTCAGGIRGAGTVIYPGQLPVEAARASFCDSESWSGTVRLQAVSFTSLNPDDLGNFASKVSFLGCSGYFAAGELACQTQIELADPTGSYPIALTVVNGHAGAVTQLSRLVGRGKLAFTGNPMENAARVLIPNVRDFAGSITVSSLSAGLVLGVTLDEYVPDDEYSGRITLLSGTATIASNEVWTASNGIQVSGGTVLNDRGEIKSAVQGSGTVRYTGTLPASRPETAARFNQSTWSGTVRFDEAVLNGGSLANCGNPSSVILLQDSCGQLPAQTVSAELRLEGGGFTVTGAVASATVAFERLTGAGRLTIDAGSKAAGAAYRLGNVVNFTGSIDVRPGTVSVLMGSANRGSHDGAIVVADGFSLPVNRDWAADRVYFEGAVTVEGGLGDTVLYVTGDETCTFDYVKPNVLGGDPARRYSLDFDPDSRAVYVATAPVPPTLTVSDVIVDYGIDFTNVAVSVAIEDYWEGFDYDGGMLAELLVRDGAGEVVASGSVVVTGDGVYDFGSFELVGAAGGDFSYEVTVTSRESAFGRSEEIGGRGAASQGVRLAADWFYEDAVTFKATKTADKTGVWTWPGATPLAFVSNSLIRIETDSTDGSVVDFTPYRNATGDVVRVEMEAVFEDIYFPDTYTLPEDLVAAITLLADGDNDECAYAIWDPVETNLVKVYGGPASVPRPGATNLFTVTFNYRTGFMSYSVDDAVLTNVEGRAHFAIPEALKAERSAKVVEVGGKGFFKALAGGQYNGNLAAFDGREYATVDEAIAAAAAAGRNDGLSLLWDATWRPSEDDLGKTYVFDLDGHRLAVDPKSVTKMERGGYRVIDNGDGSFTVGVVTYTVAFSAADAVSGEMLPQPYSVTNMVFALATNRFIRAGFDFRAWNLAEDGSGAREWSDGEAIDMSAFGLTNLTLYAQWKIAARLITVEPADEFVYLEQVTTNGAVNAGVRYFGTDAAAARGRAEIPVENGSTVRLVFSTDLGKALTYTATNLNEVAASETLVSACLPKLVSPGLPTSLADAMTSWADRRGISRAALGASPYAVSSYRLNTTALLEEKSVVEIADFKVIDGGCRFTVAVDGVPLADAPKVAGMVWVSDDLASGWAPAPEANVSVTADGVVTVLTDSPGQFIKLVIPQN